MSLTPANGLDSDTPSPQQSLADSNGDWLSVDSSGGHSWLVPAEGVGQNAEQEDFEGTQSKDDPPEDKPDAPEEELYYNSDYSAWMPRTADLAWAAENLSAAAQEAADLAAALTDLPPSPQDGVAAAAAAAAAAEPDEPLWLSRAAASLGEASPSATPPVPVAPATPAQEAA